jgi:steroid delta-isomerase-like uncharacterized protein
MNSTEEKNVETVRRFYEECLNGNRIELLPALMSETIVVHPSERNGLEDFRAFLGELRTVFPDQRFHVEDIFGRGDRVAARWTMQATHSAPLAGIAATGKKVTQTANIIYRMEDGKIAEFWSQIDQAGMLRQLGALPPAPAGLGARAAAEARQA